MTQTIIKVPAAGAFDPTDIEITDNTSGAFLIKEGSNEYMRINTTNGSEQMVLKGNPGGAGTLQYAGLYLVTNPYLQGSDNNNVQLNTSGIVLQTGNAGNRCDVYAIQTGNSFRVLGTGGTERFKVLDDSNATFTLDSGNSAVFKVQDDAGSPHEYMKIDTTSGQPGVTIKMPTGVPLRFQADQYQGLNASGSVYRAFSIGSANNWAFGDMTSASPGYLRGYANDIQIIHAATSGSNSGVKMRARGAGTGDTFKIQSDTVTNFEVDQDSNATFTLDDTSGAVFKIVDDGSSPYTYLSATEGENCVRMQSLRTDSSGLLQLQNNAGTAILQIYQNSYLQRFVQPRDSKTRTGLTGSGASQSTTIDFRLGSVKGVQHLQINHGYSGTQTVTLNFNNTLSGFAGNQDWGVNSLLVLVENLTTGQDVTFQIRETTGGTTTFIDHTGASLSDPTGSGSLTLKNAGAASGKNFITFRVTQFNNSHGSASIFDDDRYIVEALTAELY